MQTQPPPPNTYWQWSHWIGRPCRRATNVPQHAYSSPCARPHEMVYLFYFCRRVSHLLPWIVHMLVTSSTLLPPVAAVLAHLGTHMRFRQNRQLAASRLRLKRRFRQKRQLASLHNSFFPYRISRFRQNRQLLSRAHRTARLPPNLKIRQKRQLAHSLTASVLSTHPRFRQKRQLAHRPLRVRLLSVISAGFRPKSRNHGTSRPPSPLASYAKSKSWRKRPRVPVPPSRRDGKPDAAELATIGKRSGRKAKQGSGGC